MPEPSASPTPPGLRSVGVWMGMVVVALALVVGLMFLGGNDENGTTDSPQRVDPAALAEDFARAWQAGDWTTVTRLSNDAVTSTAREWFVEGLRVAVVEPMGDAGGELLATDPNGGQALIFRVDIERADGALRIVELEFGGDAG